VLHTGQRDIWNFFPFADLARNDEDERELKSSAKVGDGWRLLEMDRDGWSLLERNGDGWRGLQVEDV